MLGKDTTIGQLLTHLIGEKPINEQRYMPIEC